MNQPTFYQISACLLLISFTLAVQAAPVEPVQTTYFPETYQAPAMDGVREDLYSAEHSTAIFNPTGYDGDADFTAVFSVCWDNKYLYLYADISDDVEHCYRWGVGNPWEFDNIEIFLQLDTCTAPTSYNETTAQIRICRGLDSVESPGRTARSDFLYYMETSIPGGWITEVAVPWEAALPVGVTNEDICEYITHYSIGFDFAGADSDNSDGDPSVGNRDVQTAWDMDDPDDPDDRTEDLAWNNTSVFGYAALSGYSHLCPQINAVENNKENLLIYPNPAKSSIQFNDIREYCHIMICDLQGNIVLQTGYHPVQELDVSFLSSGLYTLVVNGKNNGRFIKH